MSPELDNKKLYQAFGVVCSILDKTLGKHACNDEEKAVFAYLVLEIIKPEMEDLKAAIAAETEVGDK